MESLEQLPDRLASLELQISQFREEVRVEFSAVRGEMRAEMRALHEEVISRISLLGEAGRG